MCDLCVSVVHCFLLLTADASSLEITHPMHYDLSKHGALIERKALEVQTKYMLKKDKDLSLIHI